jgi:hypothetical protein
MESILKDRFGELPNFFCGDDYSHAYPCERRFGDGFIPALFGSTINFEDESGHPFAVGMELSDSQVENLTVPELTNNPVIQRLLPENRGGFSRTSGELGFEGVLNIAFKLRGQEVFVDMVQKKDLFHHLCDVICKTIDGVVHLVREWQDPEHLRPKYLVTANCLMNMISNEMYREQLYEFDDRFNRSFELFGIHTCNWKVDPYLESIAEINRDLHYLDMGYESDIDRVHELFPNLRPAVFIHPERLRQNTADQLRKDITEVCRKVGSGYILLSDLEAGTDDSKIRIVYETASKF